MFEANHEKQSSPSATASASLCTLVGIKRTVTGRLLEQIERKEIKGRVVSRMGTQMNHCAPLAGS